MKANNCCRKHPTLFNFCVFSNVLGLVLVFEKAYCHLIYIKGKQAISK